jgi:hypothetical protein
MNRSIGRRSAMPFLGLLASVALISGACTEAARAGNTAVDSYVADLEAAAYTVTIDPQPVEHPSLNADGTLLHLDKYGATATVELLSYNSTQAMNADWITADGEPPVALQPAPDLAGKALYWHGTSVLVVDYEAQADAGTAWIAALVFLGLKNISPDGLPVGITPSGVIDGGGP